MTFGRRRLKLILLGNAVLVAAVYGCVGEEPDVDKSTPQTGNDDGSTSNGTDGATGGGGDSGATTDSNAPGSIVTVKGKVLGLLQEPIVGADVTIAGKKTATSIDGSFEIANVTTPYDVTASITNGVVGDSATIWVGLTRSDPTLRASVAAFEFTTINCSGGISADASADIEVLWGTSFGRSRANPRKAEIAADGGLRFDIHTAVANTPGAKYPGILHAMEVVIGANGLPTSLGSHAGSTVGDVTPAQDTEVLDFLLGSPIQSALATIPVTVPAGFSLQTATAEYRFDQNNPYRFYDTAPVANPVTMAVGTAMGLSNGLTVLAKSDAVLPTEDTVLTSVPAAVGAAAIILPTVDSKITAPTSAATNFGTGSTITWSATTGAVYDVLIESTAASNPPSLRVTAITAANTFVVPDLGALKLPSAAPYRITVTAHKPYTKTDDVTNLNGFALQATQTTSAIAITLK